MKCPLLMIGANANSNPNAIIREGTSCIGNECAWWSEGYAECAILTNCVTLEEIKMAIERDTEFKLRR